MKRSYIYIISGAILLSIASCKRQELCKFKSQSDTAPIALSINWDRSGLNKDEINNVSIYAYPEDGTSPFTKVSGSIESANINLPAGVYTLMVFNDIAGDIRGLNFIGMKSYDEAKIEMMPRDNINDLYYDVTDNEVVVKDQDPLAAWRMMELEVTPEIVKCLYCEEYHEELDAIKLNATPTAVTTPCTVIIGVENLNNANIIQGVLRGFADGIYLSTEERISNDNIDNLYALNFIKYTYDDQENRDGTVETQITTLGKTPNENQNYELIIDAILNSGEKVTFTRDVTDQVNSQDNSNIVIKLTADDNKIALPAGKGMGFGVEGWGDRESVELL